MKTILAALMALSAPAMAGTCDALKLIKIEMAVVASNIANVETTRVPEGGPYLPKRLVCDSDACEVFAQPKIKYIYEPEHPDANAQGYVAYPDINLAEQEAAMNNLVRDYETAAGMCSNDD